MGQMGSRLALALAGVDATGFWMISDPTLASVSAIVVLMAYAHRTARRSQFSSLVAFFAFLLKDIRCCEPRNGVP